MFVRGKLHTLRTLGAQPGHVLRVHIGGLNIGYDAELELKKAELGEGPAAWPSSAPDQRHTMLDHLHRYAILVKIWSSHALDLISPGLESAACNFPRV